MVERDDAPVPTAAPMFTVVMPLFNKAAHVGATLASVAAQTFDDYEMVVVDDGSTDDGPARVAAMGGRVRLVRQRNAGPGLARNRGITEARGAWVAFVDADDLWLPDHLATLAGTIGACPRADVVATGFVRGVSADAVDQGGGTPRAIDFFAAHQLIWTSTVAVRTAVLREEGFGAVWPGEDVELWTRLALRHGFAVHPRRTAVYVQHTGGAMDSQASGDGFTPIAHQPLFATIDAVLGDARLAPRHGAIAAFRNALLLDYTRPSLFNGQAALARSYLRALREGGGRAPLSYRILAQVPGPLLRRISRLYSAAKRRWRR